MPPDTPTISNPEWNYQQRASWHRPRPNTESQCASTHVCPVDATMRSADPRQHVTARPLQPIDEPRPRADAWTESQTPSATRNRATDSERGHRPQRPVSHQSQRIQMWTEAIYWDFLFGKTLLTQARQMKRERDADTDYEVDRCRMGLAVRTPDGPCDS